MPGIRWTETTVPPGRKHETSQEPATRTTPAVEGRSREWQTADAAAKFGAGTIPWFFAGRLFVEQHLLRILSSVERQHPLLKFQLEVILDLLEIIG